MDTLHEIAIRITQIHSRIENIKKQILIEDIHILDIDHKTFRKEYYKIADEIEILFENLNSLEDLYLSQVLNLRELLGMAKETLFYTVYQFYETREKLKI